MFLKQRFRQKLISAAYPFGWNTSSFIPSMAIQRFLKGKKKILIIGDYTCRDYKVLSEERKKEDIYMLDIVEPCLSVKNFIKLDVQQKLPFPNEFFDGVVMAEVIEHLFHDVSTLKEIHRVLKPDGILAMTVPYLHDEPEYHVRVHTYNSVRRLIEFCGFRIEEHFYRGIVCALPNKNFFTMLFFYFPFILTSINPRMFQKVMKFYFLLEVLIGKKLPRLQKFWPSYGGILKAVKSSPKDFLEVQIKSFGTK